MIGSPGPGLGVGVVIRGRWRNAGAITDTSGHSGGER